MTSALPLRKTFHSWSLTTSLKWHTEKALVCRATKTGQAHIGAEVPSCASQVHRTWLLLLHGEKSKWRPGSTEVKFLPWLYLTPGKFTGSHSTMFKVTINCDWSNIVQFKPYWETTPVVESRWLALVLQNSPGLENWGKKNLLQPCQSGTAAAKRHAPSGLFALLDVRTACPEGEKC